MDEDDLSLEVYMPVTGSEQTRVYAHSIYSNLIISIALIIARGEICKVKLITRIIGPSR
jgi:hypothetical protein